jgi:hypothetical protein
MNHDMVDSLLSVNVVDSMSSILFDTVVVVVTLASTLGTWRVYKRSPWNRLSLTHLLAQQSKSWSLQNDSHKQTSISGLMRFGYLIRFHRK